MKKRKITATLDWVTWNCQTGECKFRICIKCLARDPHKGDHRWLIIQTVTTETEPGIYFQWDGMDPQEKWTWEEKQVKKRELQKQIEALREDLGALTRRVWALEGKSAPAGTPVHADPIGGVYKAAVLQTPGLVYHATDTGGGAFVRVPSPPEKPVAPRNGAEEY